MFPIPLFYFSLMASETDISNFALQHLGQSQIASSLDTVDKESRLCALNYPQARDEVLAAAMWSCAKRSGTLSKLPESPAYKWGAAYQLPTDFIRLVEIEGQTAWTQTEFFDRQGDLLLINRGGEDGPCSLNIEYISRLEDASRYDASLVEAIAIKLASKLARSLTGSESRAMELRKEYEQVILPNARTIHAAQLYSGKNHPLRQIMQRNFLRGGFGESPDACVKAETIPAPQPQFQ